jgi:hypothetical protein
MIPAPVVISLVLVLQGLPLLVLGFLEYAVPVQEGLDGLGEAEVPLAVGRHHRIEEVVAILPADIVRGHPIDMDYDGGGLVPLVVVDPEDPGEVSQELVLGLDFLVGRGGEPQGGPRLLPVGGDLLGRLRAP